MKNANIINKRIVDIPNSGCYVDPLKTDRDKHAGVYRLTPNKPIETVVSQSFVGVGPQRMIPQNTTGINTRPATQKTYGMDNSIEESNTNRNMKKNVVKINENTLRQIVAESVKRVLKENVEELTYQEGQILQKALIGLFEAEKKIKKLYSGSPQDSERALKILHDARTSFFEAGITGGEMHLPGEYKEPDYLDGAGYQY